MPPGVAGSRSGFPELRPSAELTVGDLARAGGPTLRGSHRQVPNLGGASDPLKEFARGRFRRLLDETLPSFFRLPVPLLFGLQAHLLQAVPRLSGNIRPSYRRPV
eukprot:710313-Amphidinium_carterae.1